MLSQNQSSSSWLQMSLVGTVLIALSTSSFSFADATHLPVAPQAPTAGDRNEVKLRLAAARALAILTYQIALKKDDRSIASEPDPETKRQRVQLKASHEEKLRTLTRLIDGMAGKNESSKLGYRVVSLSDFVRLNKKTRSDVAQVRHLRDSEYQRTKNLKAPSVLALDKKLKQLKLIQHWVERVTRFNSAKITHEVELAAARNHVAVPPLPHSAAESAVGDGPSTVDGG